MCGNTLSHAKSALQSPQPQLAFRVLEEPEDISLLLEELEIVEELSELNVDGELDEDDELELEEELIS